jgi:hypothetical protein
MKISAWAKKRGDRPILVQCHAKSILFPPPPWKSVWVSCVFTWNRYIAEYYAKLFPSVETHVGGSGVNLTERLPAEVEAMVPDYDLYTKQKEGKIWRKVAVGFVQRGCIRKCEFCIVPLKEGRLADNVYRPLEEWVPQGFTKILLLDNEFAATPYQVQVLETVIDHKWKLSITQGYDLRCVDKPHAELLASWKPYDMKFRIRRLYCAWDYFAIEPYVRRGIETLKAAGFNGSEIMCYCLVGFNTSHVQDYYRFHVLWKQYKVLPFIMRYNLRTDDPFIYALARYANRGPIVYRNHSFPDFCKRYFPEVYKEAVAVVARCEANQHIAVDMEPRQPIMAAWYK